MIWLIKKVLFATNSLDSRQVALHKLINRASMKSETDLIFHFKNRLEIQQLYKLKHLWIDIVIWYYYKVL